MTKANTYSVIAIVAVIVGAAFQWGLFSRTDRIAQYQTNKALSARAVSPELQDPNTASETAPKFSADNGPGPPNKSKSSPTATAASSPDKSVIGILFPVSASINSACKPLSPSGAGAICDRLKRDLSDMAAEPRDPSWAVDMETKLQNFVESQRSDVFSVRNIECRATRCAIEVASPYGNYFASVFPLGNSLGDQLHATGNFAVATETETTGEKLTVVLYTYARR
jgi:hypothetical protein